MLSLAIHPQSFASGYTLMSNLFRWILFLVAGFSLFVSTDALAFDFGSNLSSTLESFRFLEQPSQRLNFVQPIMPMTAVPTVSRGSALPLNVKRPARLVAGSNAAFLHWMQSIHTRIESLSWNQRVSDQFDSENQDGFLRALGFKRVTAAERFPADNLKAEQDNDTSDFLEPSGGQSGSLFGSSKILGQQPFVEQHLWPGIDLGTDMNLPLGESPIQLLDPGAANLAATGGLSAAFRYADTDTKRLPLPKVQFSGRGRLGLTPASYESLNVYLPVMIYPRTILVNDNDWHSDGLFFGAYVEGAASSQSVLVGGLTQAPSTTVTVGLKTGVNF